MNIGLDFDGVIADSGKLKSHHAKKLYGVNIPPSRFKKDIVVQEDILTEEQYWDLLKIVHGTLEAGLLMEPVEGMLHYLPRLMADGHSTVVITSRNETLGVAKEWALRQGLNLNFIGVGFDSKAKAAQGLDFFVDDDLEKLESLVGVVSHRYLFSRDYNAHLNSGDIAKRLSSWEELYRIVTELSGK